MSIFWAALSTGGLYRQTLIMANSPQIIKMTKPDSIAVKSSRAFPGPGEQLNKPGFKSIEFDGFKNELGSCSKGVEFDPLPQAGCLPGDPSGFADFGSM